MVRNIVGVLFLVLQNKIDINDLRKLFDYNSKGFRFKPAPARGLSLVSVTY
ncbi:hypothetical protein ACFLZV_01685 [Candidatus Margulisiibacteriota bacterium]